MVTFSMTFSDLEPTVQGHDIIIRQITVGSRLREVLEMLLNVLPRNVNKFEENDAGFAFRTHQSLTTSKIFNLI